MRLEYNRGFDFRVCLIIKDEERNGWARKDD